ncbi:MAG: ABC transporter substrate-binding protein [Armatimonadota bacterium]|nr:ABC transporter substrate-binding protein [Armatimonadota bacterium]MDR7451336.1 ABC transporter substrate-binding protein [Armatimonadota bacterium]MDR7466760.1 ABC transporter substrate-binding protein [Armatimonadota bacterium]MDR7492766.1 ABC transporter substrate-binding protein [Armatimonadota bacterium]MDR7498542.1 ABC transporter substrate-binding protein [Armatimonadota bacterium]
MHENRNLPMAFRSKVAREDCCRDAAGVRPSAASTTGSAIDTARFPRRELLRRALRTAAAAAALSLLPRPVGAQAPRKIRLGFCSQVLCIIPYEVARSQGFYAGEGLDVELVYFRGGTAAMQALIGGAIDYAATSYDVSVAAFGRGADIVSFFTTGRLPFFALAVGPKTAAAIRGLPDLAGRTVGVSAAGNADHQLSIYLLRRAGIDPAAVRFAVLGPNLYEALRVGHVDAGMVQEPATTLIARAGGRVLVNLMDPAQADRYLGGPYAHMGVAVRRQEWDSRRQEMQALARALRRSLRFMRIGTPRLLVDALPPDLIAGGDRALLEQILARRRRVLYTDDGRIALDAVRRVAEVARQAGALPVNVDVTRLITYGILDSL